MRLLIGCEHSARVRDAFRVRGHDAWSCDLVATDGDPRYHFQQDIHEVLAWQSWDALIAFPPCTRLCASGARWWNQYASEHHAAIEFVQRLMMFPRYAIENPIGAISKAIRKPDQIIQPWQYGHGETKATCLWLEGFPRLTPTNVVEGREQRIHKLPQNAARSRLRSLTYPGIAEAMAAQWGVA